jgi:hypothetical protein
MSAVTIVLSVLLALTIASNADPKVINKRDRFPSFTTPDFYAVFCQNSFFAQQYPATCSKTTPATAPTSTSTQSSTTSDAFVYQTSTPGSFQLENTTLPDGSSTNLERAHWCRFNNGSYLSLGYIFTYSDCAVCQCTQSHAIRCVTLQCMPTFCIDGTTPLRRPNQCCSQCAYENGSSSCPYKGATYPHGKHSLSFSFGVNEDVDIILH